MVQNAKSEFLKDSSQFLNSCFSIITDSISSFKITIYSLFFFVWKIFDQNSLNLFRAVLMRRIISTNFYSERFLCMHLLRQIFMYTFIHTQNKKLGLYVP